MDDKLQRIRDHVDSHDVSEEIEQGHWETDVVDDPMITTSLRLPKSLLDWVRAQAAEQHVKPTAWIRELLEQQRTGQPDLEHRVGALEATLTSMLAAAAQPQRKKTKVAAVNKTAKGRATRVRVARGAHENIEKLHRLTAGHITKKNQPPT
jgi:predicted DNA binding CopG/RHH family protein